MTTPGMNQFCIHTIVQHMPTPSSRQPITPSVTDTTVPFFEALRSNRRSCSILSSSFGRYLLRMFRISSCCFDE